MNAQPDVEPTPEAVRAAGSKAAQVRRMADADDRLVRAAKLRFKSARKSWKLARRVANRSAQRAERAEKKVLKLQKQLKQARKKSSAKCAARVAAPARPLPELPFAALRRTKKRPGPAASPSAPEKASSRV